MCIRDSDVDLVAATHGPGLVGALLVGVSAAKALAVAWQKPFVGVNHVEGHLFAVNLDTVTPELPFVILLVAGGHTRIVHVPAFGDYRVLGSTIDDAAGEAFDKVARYLDLGYPGGPVIDELATKGDRGAIHFPRGMQDDSFDFSFSGLKTAVINYVRKHPEATTEDLAASFQEAVVDVLVDKTVAAAKSVGVEYVCMGGGVSANSRLREVMTERVQAAGMNCVLPSVQYCTDNAAMIAAAAEWTYTYQGPSDLSLGAVPSLPLG